MGGEVLQELRDISASSKRISQTQLRLALAVTAEVAASVTDMHNVMNDQFTKIIAAIEAQNANIEIIKDQLEGVEKQIAVCESVKRNPFIQMGGWITEHPKMAASTLSISGVVMLVLLTLWLDPGVRRVTFEFLRFPAGVVSMLAR